MRSLISLRPLRPSLLRSFPNITPLWSLPPQGKPPNVPNEYMHWHVAPKADGEKMRASSLGLDQLLPIHTCCLSYTYYT